MKKKFLFMFCLSLTVITGCWDQAELDDITVVSAIAIDKGKEHKYRLTTEFFNVNALDPDTRGAETASIIFSLEGNTIAELAKKMNVMATRKLIYSHMRVVVMSKEIAQEGLLEFLDFFEADREIRNDFNFLVVDNVAAKDVLKINYPIQQVSSLKIHEQLDTMVKEWGGDPDIRMKDFIVALLSPGREPIAPEVKVIGSPEQGKKRSNMEKVEMDALVILDGLAIFNGMKYVGQLPIKHVRNFLLLQDKLRRTSITTMCGEEKSMAARITNSKTRVKARYDKDLPKFNVNIDLEGRLETIQCPIEIVDLQAYLDMEKQFAKAFEKEIEETIRILQEDFQLDIFGFGEHMERQNYQQFKKVKDEWNEEFAKANIDVNVTLKLRRTGLIHDPFLVEMEDEE